MNSTQLKALALVKQGKGDMLSHFINDDPDQGFSSPITIDDYSKGGYTSVYYFLNEIANPANWDGDEFLL